MSTLVRFETTKDEDAHSVGTLLQALGFEAVRVFPDAESALVTPAARVTRAVSRLARSHKLTQRQQETTLMLVQGANLQTIADALGISRATVKWHAHSVYTLTDTPSSIALTRKVFNLAMQGF